MATLKDIIKLAKQLPESAFSDAFDKLSKIKEDAQVSKANELVMCISCGSKKVVKNGKSSGKQAFVCKDCGKAFLENSTSSISNSHSSPALWRTVIKDTLLGVSLAKTAKDLDISEQTAFNMRHKILYAIEQAAADTPIHLEGACQVDETYILECEKGKEFLDPYTRPPRNNGKASKQGLSQEHICLCTAATSEGKLIAKAVNRSTPSKEEVEEVFGRRIEDDTILLVDGNKSYNTLKDRIPVIQVKKGENTKTDRFHSFIKGRIADYRGVSTKFLNRYAAMFSEVSGNTDSIDKVCDKIFELMTDRSGKFETHRNIAEKNLLIL
jgi:transposase-like protein